MSGAQRACLGWCVKSQTVQELRVRWARKRGIIQQGTSSQWSKGAREQIVHCTLVGHVTWLFSLICGRVVLYRYCCAWANSFPPSLSVVGWVLDTCSLTANSKVHYPSYFQCLCPYSMRKSRKLCYRERNITKVGSYMTADIPDCTWLILCNCTLYDQPRGYVSTINYSIVSSIRPLCWFVDLL